MRAQLPLAALLTLALAAPGSAAAPKPQITDPAGDAVPAVGAGYDIVSALFKTDGITTKVGRKKVYTPTKLVVVVTYAGNVPTDKHAAQVLEFDAPGCADVYLESYSGGTYGLADCVPDSFEFSVKPSGKTLTITLPFSLNKSSFKKGAVLTGLRTYTAGADPLVGYETAELTQGVGTFDNATSTATYKIA